MFEVDLNNLKEFAQPKIIIGNDLATLEDVEELVSLRDINNKRWIMKKMNEGDLCFCSKLNGKIIGYCWYSTKFGDVPLVKSFKVPDKAVYSYDSYTVPDYRRLGVSTALSLYALSYLSKKGYQDLYFLVDIDNVPNIKLNEQIGAKNLGILKAKKTLWHRSYTVYSDTPENTIKIKKYCNII